VHVRSQSPASIRFLWVSIDLFRGDVLLEPIQLGQEFFDSLLDILELLRKTVSVLEDGHPPNQYLKMLDERVYPTESGF